MNWSDLERAFSRAVTLSFSKKKLALAFPVLVFCGIFVVFCRAVAFETGEWVSMSFVFLPILLSSGILFALGILLIRMHHHEAKQLTLDFKKLMSHSAELIIGTSYLSIVPILIYLCLWIILGVFFLLKETPLLGNFFSVVLSFGPFLLIFSSLALCLFNLGLLFFGAPVVALQSPIRDSLARQISLVLRHRLLSGLALFMLALLPTLLVAGALCLAAILTNVSFSIAGRSLSVALEWFFIMLPFAAILAPVVVFFFNFAAESYQLLQGSTVSSGFVYGESVKASSRSNASTE
ncbi:MAG: hypothetical protein HY861_02260 [Chlamydiia bacterium]|nr:hypothetical protein [Chlamydiia bacterium]